MYRKTLTMLFFCFIFSLLSLRTGFVFAGAENAASCAKDAYNYARRAFIANTLSDLKYQAYKAMEAAEKAKLAATDVGAYEAARLANAAYDYAKKARATNSLAQARNYSEKAMSAAQQAQSAAEKPEPPAKAAE